MKTKKLKFVQDAIYNGSLVYRSGEIADVPVEAGYALRWEKRGIAIEADLESEVKEIPRPKGSFNKKKIEQEKMPKQYEEGQVEL